MRGFAEGLALCLPLAVAVGCGAEASPPAVAGPAHGLQGASSGTAVERFFPLVDGNVYHYITEGDAGEAGLLVARVFRTDAAHGELRFPAGSKRFEYAEDGVKLQAGMGANYVLKVPLELGASWIGEHGGKTKIIAVSAAVDVKAGHFTRCVQTLEERGGDRPARYATTFCPDTGVVLLEASSGAAIERAELKSYGAPVQIGPDGLERTRVAPAEPAPKP